MEQKGIADHFGGFCAWVNQLTILGVLRMGQKADHLWGFFTWVKKRKPTIFGVLGMGQKADHLWGVLAWVTKPTILGGTWHGSKSRPSWVVLGIGLKAV